MWVSPLFDKIVSGNFEEEFVIFHSNPGTRTGQQLDLILMRQSFAVAPMMGRISGSKWIG